MRSRYAKRPPHATGLLAAGLILALAWGGMQFMARRQLEVQAENMYQRAFHQLSWHLNGLESQLATSLASHSPEALTLLFADAWRLSYSAQQEVAQLPVAAIPLNATETFLAQVGTITMQLSERTSKGRNLTDKQWQILQNTYQRARFLNDRLQLMRAQLFDRQRPWTQVGQVLMTSAARPGEQAAQPVDPAAKSLLEIEDGMRRLPDPDFQGELRPFQKPIAPPSGGAEVTREQAVRIARRFLGEERAASLDFMPVEAKGGRVDVWSVEGAPRSDALVTTRRLHRVWLDVRRRGGQVVWMLDERDVPSRAIPTARTVALGLQFLDEHGYPSMEAISTEQNQNRAVITYVHRQGGVLIYPDQVRLQVALDSGEVVGFEGLGFITFHKARTLLLPRLSEREAAAKLNPRLRVDRSRLAIILNHAFDEVLTYEFRGKIEADQYLVYINALTGREEKVMRTQPGEVQEQQG